MRDIRSPLAQLQHEVTTLTKIERESLLDSVMGSENTVEIPADEVLAMKTEKVCYSNPK